MNLHKIQCGRCSRVTHEAFGPGSQLLPARGVSHTKLAFLYTACEFAMWNWLPKFLIAAGVPTVSALDILSLGFACGMLLGRLGAVDIL